MLNGPRPDKHGQLRIHTSDRGTFKRCRQQWEFSSPLRYSLEPIRPAEPLWFGTGMHEALAAYYEPSTPRNFALAIEAWDLFCKGERNRYIEEEGDLWIEEEEHFNEMESLGQQMLHNYCVDFASKEDNFDVQWVERQYKVSIFEFDGTEVVYSFKCDGLVKDPYGRYFILEHKTAQSIFTNREWLQMDDQIGSYIYFLQQVLDIPIEGVIYNTLRKKAPKPLRELKSGSLSRDKSQDTTYDIAARNLRNRYGGTIPTEYKEFLEYLLAQGNTFFHRDIVRRNTKEIEKLGEEILAEAKMMVDPDTIITRTPSPFTCNRCPFVAPCIAKYEDSDWEFMLEGNYQRRTHGE